MGLPDLFVRIGLDSEAFRAGMEQVRSEVRQTSASFSAIASVGSTLSSLGTTLTAAVTLPLVGIGIAAVKSASDMEGLRAAFTAVTGSADKASAALAMVREVAKLPGLTFEDAAKGAVNLMAVGATAEGTERILRSFGNALATVGRGGEDLSAVVVQLTQMAAKSQVVAGDLKPILERVPQAVGIIRQAFGTIDTEELQKKKVSTQQFIEVLVTGLEKLPPAASTARNEFENARDTVTQALAQIGQAIAPLVVQIVNTLVPAIQSVTSAFASLPPSVQQAIIVLATAAAAIGPLLAIVGQLMVGVKTVAAGFTALMGIAQLQPILAAIGSALSALGAALGSAAAAAWVFLAPFLLIAAKIALIAAAIGALVYGVSKLADAFGGPTIKSALGGFARWVDNGVGALKRWVSGSGEASKSSDTAKQSTEKLGAEMKSLQASADETTKGLFKFSAAPKAAADETKKLEQQLKELRNATIQARTENLEHDITWRAIIQSVSDVGRRYKELTDWLVNAKARMIEGKDATWAMNTAMAEFDALLDSASRSTQTATQNIDALTREVMSTMPSAASAAYDAAKKVEDAWKTLGLPSPSEIEAKKKAAQEAFETIKNSGTASAEDIQRAYEALAGKQGVGKVEETINRVSTAMSQGVQDMVGILIGTESGSLLDALGKLGRGILSDMVEPWLSAFGRLIEEGVKKLIAWLLEETGLSGAIKAIGGALGGLIGGAGAAAGTAAGAAAGAAGAGAAGAAAGAAGAGAAGAGAAGAAAGAAGAAAGVGISIGTSLLTGGIAGGLAIVGSIIGAKMLSGDMGKVEENTRYTAIALIGSLGVIDLLWKQLDHWWYARGVWEKTAETLGWIWEQASAVWPVQLDRMAAILDRLAEMPDRISERQQPVSITVQGNVIGQEEFLRQLADEIGRRLSLQGAR